jgi:hypothetical protein
MHPLSQLTAAAGAAWRAAAVLALVSATLDAAHAEDLTLQSFVDPEDGQLDLSEWLLDRKGLLPVPVVITEPAVGFGAGVMGLFFRESMREAATRSSDAGRLTPPDIYAIGGGATENGTKFGAAGGMVSFDDNRYRWRGAVSRMSVNLDFYGAGGQRAPLAYNLDGWVSVQQGMKRLGDSDMWVVARWNYLDLRSRFDLEADAARFGDIVRSARSSGLGLSLEVDSRDNIFTPSRGWKGSLDLTWYDPDWGSDTRFRSYRAHAFAYWPLAREFVLAGRIDGRAAEGEVPFYMLPYIDLRGVPAFRLQDRRTAVLETEARWNLTPRWALIGFIGAGRAWGSVSSEGTDTVARGVGFRYQIARRLGLYAGIDVAKSTQDQAIYLQTGSAWR